MRYHTVLVDLPTTIPGFAKRDPIDDFTTIVLNARMSHEGNCETYMHEMYHDDEGDFDCKGDVNIIEGRAHRRKSS